MDRLPDAFDRRDSSGDLLCCRRHAQRLPATRTPIERILAAGQQAMLERHYGQAVHILRNGLKDHPEDNRLRLELGRAYLSKGSDGQAIRLFRKILVTDPNNRSAKLDLARALSYRPPV